MYVKNPHDDKFLSCAMAAHADLIVTGDQAFYELKKFKSVKIVSPAAFLKDVVLKPSSNRLNAGRIIMKA